MPIPRPPLLLRLGRAGQAGMLALWLSGLVPASASAQDLDFTAVRAEVDFSKRLQTWDGFGFNYVQSAQTMDYANDPQEYGGFSLLKEEDRQKIVDLVFGDEGLRVGLLKMFLDPWHQVRPGRPYDHETTTQWLRYFAREGVKKSRATGRDLTIITTLYGPPAYMTRQKVMRGRDLDPAHQRDLALYLVNWVKFLGEKEGLPVNYVSLHNEAEAMGHGSENTRAPALICCGPSAPNSTPGDLDEMEPDGRQEPQGTPRQHLHGQGQWHLPAALFSDSQAGDTAFMLIQ